MQWSSSGSWNQQWSIETVDGYVKIKNRATGLYLDGMGRTTNGSAVGQWENSGSWNQQWTFVNVQDGGGGGGTGTVATPTFFPAGGTYDAPQSVSISCATEGVTIRYTTDGSTPNANSPQYTVPFTVSSNMTIKAIAMKAGMNDSEVATATYIINGSGGGGSERVAAPVFSIPGGTYSSKQKVKLSCATSGATIRYTTDGSTPTANSKKYDKEINVDKSMTIKAIAIKSGMADSEVVTQTYVINGGAGGPGGKK